jgi:integrase/recombinase XerD
VALRVEDLYASGRPREYITFRARTRKTDTSGHRQTRQVPVHPTLHERLKTDDVPHNQWLFPSSRNPTKHVCFKAADLFLRNALECCGYESKGISTHSTRRSFITRLDEKGVGVKVIQAITGHGKLESVSHFPESIDSASWKAVSIALDAGLDNSSIIAEV